MFDHSLRSQSKNCIIKLSKTTKHTLHSLHSYNQVQRTTETQDIAEQRVHTMNTYLIYWLLYNYAQHTEEGRPTVRDVRAEAWFFIYAMFSSKIFSHSCFVIVTSH